MSMALTAKEKILFIPISFTSLFTELVYLGVKPYSIFHCDLLPHTKQFIVPLKKEIKIMTELRRHLTGLAYPLHVIDSASGHGKIPIPTDFWDYSLANYRDFHHHPNQL